MPNGCCLQLFLFIDRTFRNWSISKLTFFPLANFMTIFLYTFWCIRVCFSRSIDWKIFSRETKTSYSPAWICWYGERYLHGYFHWFIFFFSPCILFIIALVYGTLPGTSRLRNIDIFSVLPNEIPNRVEYCFVYDLLLHGLLFFCSNLIIHSAIVLMSKIDWIIEFCTLNSRRLYCKEQCTH